MSNRRKSLEIVRSLRVINVFVAINDDVRGIYGIVTFLIRMILVIL